MHRSRCVDTVGAAKVLIELRQRLRLSQQEDEAVLIEVDADGACGRRHCDLRRICPHRHGLVYCRHVGIVDLSVEREDAYVLQVIQLLELGDDLCMLLGILSQNQKMAACLPGETK